MKRNLTGSTTATFTVFIVSGILASVLGVRQVERLTTEEAWVVKSNMSAGQTITTDSLKQVRLNSDEAGIVMPEKFIGKRLAVNKSPGDTITQNDVAKPKSSSVAQKIPEGRVLYTIIPHKSALPHTLLRNGDRIDVLVRDRNGVHLVAEDVRLIGTIKSSSKAAASDLKGLMGMATGKKPAASNQTAWVVAVYPQDVYPLASIANNKNVSLVLHGSSTNSNQALRIRPEATHRKIELMNGLARKEIKVAR